MTPAPGVRRKAEDRHRALVYWKKALRYADAARRNAGDELWDPAVANAINAVINVVDAVCVHYRGERSAGGAHEQALEVLADTLEAPVALRRSLDRHLASLLERKNVAQYEGRLLEASETRGALQHMERAFQVATPWAGELGWPAETP